MRKIIVILALSLVVIAGDLVPQTKFQKDVESLVYNVKNDLNAQDIIVMVMNNHTGKLISLVSTNPNKAGFGSYLFEPASLMKPFTLAIALENKLVTPQTSINTYNGIWHLDKKHTIKDTKKFQKLSTTDVIVHSSNIGISQIALKMSAKVFRDGLVSFGFGQKTGIDIDKDFQGKLKSETVLNKKLYRASTAYGYGILVTPLQLLKAYAVFTNDGKIITPYIQKVISKNTAMEMKKILIKVVAQDKEINTKITGLTIGGKAGTAHMVKNAKYINSYNSSFYGFMKDDLGNSYTIGVVVIDPKAPKKHLASNSAVPLFKSVVMLMGRNL